MDKTICRTPISVKIPTRNPIWKFELIKSAILGILLKFGEGILLKELSQYVKPLISSTDLDKIGSLKWHVVSVKLELEVSVKLEELRIQDHNDY